MAFTLAFRGPARNVSSSWRLKPAIGLVSRGAHIQRLSTTPRQHTSVTLSAPNGHTWEQPTGLFINNDFVESSNGQTMSTIDP